MAKLLYSRLETGATGHVDEMHVFPVERDDRVEPGGLNAQSNRRLWHLDSEIEIDLDRMPVRAPDPELDLTIPQGTRHTNANTETSHIQARRDRSISKDRPNKDSNPVRRHDTSKTGRSVSEKTKSRLTSKQRSDSPPRESRTSRGHSASSNRRNTRARGRRDGSSDSSESLPCTENRPRRILPRTRRDETPPDDSDGDSSDSDRRDGNRRGRGYNRRNHPRRRQDFPSDNDPDDEDDGDGPSNGSTSESNGSDPATRGRKRLRIKLQKFDGTGSWESWWAHFRNCAREQIGCDHFTNALGDPDFALKVKERAPKSLDEALCIALRLEAWAKSVKQDKQEDDWPDRHRQKARASAKPDTVKQTQNSESNERLTKIETDITRLHEEIKRVLEAFKAPSVLTAVLPSSPANAPVQRQATHANPSAGERPRVQDTRNNGPVRPVMTGIFPQQRQPPTCWDCGFPGHIRRDCPMQHRPIHRNLVALFSPDIH